MKKAMTIILFLAISLFSYSQTYLYISGNVTDEGNGTPIPNHAVYIQSDSLNGGNVFPYYKVVYTNTGGAYADTVILPAGVTQWSFLLTTFDCENVAHVEDKTYEGNTTAFEQDFEICNNQEPGCHAEFSIEEEHDSTSGFTYHFEDESEGDIVSWYWNFGDGTTSNVQSPYHTYPADGIYQVCLTIQGADSSCFDTECDTLYVGGGSGCQAQYSYYPDSSNNGNTVQFLDLSTGNPSEWEWDFGEGEESDLQNPIHVFDSPGTYYVCLTIHGENCESTWCTSVTVGTNSNCVNYFTYTSAGLSVNFEGYMQNGQPATYSWNYGDGQTGSGDSVIHQYGASGVYYVSLTTTTTDSTNCTYTSNQLIMVGDSGQFNQVYGQVFAGEFPLQSGIAMIFSLDSNQNYSPYIATCPIDSMGLYYFSMVPNGNYYVYAIPFVPDDYLPTYYGDKLEWEDATIISLGQASNPYDIHLIPEDSCDYGNGGISGQINLGGIKANFLDKITMILMKADGSPIGYYRVSSEGAFDFQSLGYGTYLLRAEIPGVTSDVVQVVISSENPIAEVIMTFEGNKLLGVNEEKPAVTAGPLYPNPVTDHTSVSVKAERSGTFSVEVYDLMGRRMFSFTNELQTGNNLIGIPVSQLPSGIYTLVIRSSEGMKITQKLIKQ
jgi:PKD repeat protein